MSVLPKSVEKVIESFERLPGIGPKSAARMAYFFLRAPKSRAVELARALINVKNETVTCSKCFNVADSDPCGICGDSSRDAGILCIVEDFMDVVALEHSAVYSGLYFVLGGLVSPADGIGPEALRMSELKERISPEKKLEVIIATNPSLEGEATASYIIELIRSLKNGIDVSISRIAMGLPTGADIEYADRLTLKRAIEGRTSVAI
ncbi:MAG: recombination mediator RecR [Patescibacteria group bacterium]|nr:recombination mediator RecR [Patescibacteria group bacterium]